MATTILDALTLTLQQRPIPFPALLGHPFEMKKNFVH